MPAPSPVISNPTAVMAWLVPTLPLLASLLLAILPAVSARRAAGLAIGSVALSALAAAGTAVMVWTRGIVLVSDVPWFDVGGVALTLAIRVDALAALVSLLVALVSLAVTTYAVAYLRGDPRYERFFAQLLLFVGAMLTLVAADDALLFFVAWEIVGLCSYLLIGFWFERRDVPRAATQAFLVTRHGDMALLAGLILLTREAHSASLADGIAAATSGCLAGPELMLIAALLVTGALAKSAQLPFSGWLPDAMLGPTPVSALLHSATMVAAGVYLVARLFPLFEASGILPVVAWIGAITALYGAWAALDQRDLKRLLAYSTMSQLGFMFLGLGAGSLVAGVLLLVAHACFKSLLFVGAGNVNHELASTAFAPMGGLLHRMPVTAVLFVIGAAALAGVPLIVALPAKDAALSAAARTSPALLVVALVAALGTALYSTRAFVLTFLAAPRGDAAARAQEPDAGFAAPMLTLAILLVVAAVARSPLLGEPMARLLGTAAPDVASVTITALVVTVAGIAVGAVAAQRWPGMVAWPLLAPGRELAAHGFGLPALYTHIAHATERAAARGRDLDLVAFDRPLSRLARAVRAGATGARWFDLATFEAASNWLARMTLELVRTARRFDVRRINAAFDAAARALTRVGQRLRRIETGYAYNYLVAIVAWGLGALALAALVVWLRTGT